MEYSIRIAKLGVLKKYKQYKDVVREVRFFYCITNRKQDAKKFLVLHLDLNQIDNFIELSDLSKEVVVGWVEKGLGKESISEIEKELKKMLNPDEYYYEPPFAEETDIPPTRL